MQTEWHSFKAEEFEFEGRKAALVFPHQPEPERNWTLKTEYRDAFPETELALLDKGFHVAWLANTSRFAPPTDSDAKARFVAWLHQKYNLRDQCVPVGMSCGGAHAVMLGGMHPEAVACMFIDAPVLNYCSCPGRPNDAVMRDMWEQEFTKAYPGITRADLLSFEHHPMNQIKSLKAHKIPILMLYGTEDQTVPYSENGQWMEEAYADTPNLLTVVPRPSQGHHPHGIPWNPTPIVDFIIRNTR